MLRAGKDIHVATLANQVGNFKNWQEYLDVLGDYLGRSEKIDDNISIGESSDLTVLWQGQAARIQPDVKTYGPVIVMDGANIEDGTVVFGPTFIGRDVTIGSDSIVVNSVIWDGAQVGSNCEVRHSLVDCEVKVPNNCSVCESTVPFEVHGGLKYLVTSFGDIFYKKTAHLLKTLHKLLPQQLSVLSKEYLKFLVISLLCVAFLWSYWPGLKNLWYMWTSSDEHSSGLLIPFLTVLVLWSRRDMLASTVIKPCFWGIPALIAAQAVRLNGLYYLYGSAERLSIVLSITALVLLLLGWGFVRKIWSILLFLCLMLPWPNRVQTAVTIPLQDWATSSAVFCLELFGYEVIKDGNIIHIGNISVAVVEACNGLRMVLAFFVVSGLVALLIKRAWWEKMIIIASSLPIALICNTLRLTITAIAFTVLNGEKWEKAFHDFGGYAMMPLALAVIVAELWLLNKLTVIPNEPETVKVAG
jgi:exosortase